jgi:hypothetical protein
VLRLHNGAGPSEASTGKVLHNTVTIGPEMAHEMEVAVCQGTNSLLFPDPVRSQCSLNPDAAICDREMEAEQADTRQQGDRVNASSTGSVDSHGLPSAPFSKRRNPLGSEVG